MSLKCHIRHSFIRLFAQRENGQNKAYMQDNKATLAALTAAL